MKTKSKKKIIISVIIALIIVLAAAFFLNSIFNQKVSSESVVMSTAIVTKGDISTKIFGRGVLKPADQYEVKSLVKGEVLESDYEEGDKVKKGDVLFAISQEEVEGQLTGAKIGIKKNQNYLDNLKRQLSDLKVVASVSGTITKLDVKKGDKVSAGQVVGEITDKSKLKLTAYFAKEEASYLKGKAADIILVSTGEKIRARVVHIARNFELVDGGIQAIPVKLELNGNFSSLIGAMATAKIGESEAVKGGVLEGGETGSIVAKASGEVLSLRYAKGDYVRANALVANIDSKELHSQIETAKLDIDQAKTGLDDVKRKQKAYAITAPIEGTLVKKNKKVGDVIDPAVDSGSGGLAIIYDLSGMKLVLNIDELDVLKIEKGQKVEIEAAALPNETFDAVVENVSIQGKAEGGVTTYPITVRIDKIGKLMPGMNVTGNIYAASVKNVLIVPVSCLQRGNKLYVKDSVDGANLGKSSENTDIPLGFHEVSVEVGISDGENIEIKSGIKEGDEIYMPPEINQNEAVVMETVGNQ